VAFGQAGPHCSFRSVNFMSFSGSRLREDRQQDDSTPFYDEVRHSPSFAADEEPEFPQFARQLSPIWLTQMDTTLRQQVDVEGRMTEVIIGQSRQPPIDLWLQLDRTPAHTLNGMIP
jgi:hypothetical protein